MGFNRCAIEAGDGLYRYPCIWRVYMPFFLLLLTSVSSLLLTFEFLGFKQQWRFGGLERLSETVFVKSLWVELRWCRFVWDSSPPTITRCIDPSLNQCIFPLYKAVISSYKKVSFHPVTIIFILIVHMQLVSAFMLAIQAPLPLNHHHHHTGSNHVTPLTLVDLSRTSARDIQFLSTEKSWRRLVNLSQSNC